MKNNEDPFGQLLLAQLKNPESTVYEIIERDDDCINAASAKRYLAGYKDWPEPEQQAIKLAKGKVLDIGCGAGRVATYLQGEGFDVTGIDISPGAIKVAKLRGLKKVKLLALDQVDTFSSGEFDTVVMFGNNFGLFSSAQKAKLILRKLHKITSDDACIIAESADPYKTKDPVHLSYHELNRKRGRMPGQLKIRVRYGISTGKWLDYLLVSIKEMKELLNGTGWRADKVIKTSGPLYVSVIKKERGA